MKTTTTVTVCTCDRCGYVKDDAGEVEKGVSGEMNVQYKGHIGGKTWQGDWGGYSPSGTIWLCYQCAQDFCDFLARK